MKAIKVTVGKGRTKEEEKNWTRAYYEIEIALDSEVDIVDARNWAEQTIDGWLEPKKPAANTPQQPPKPTDYTKMFPDHLSKVLNFTVEGNILKVKPKQFLGKETFGEVADIVNNQLDGKYIAGKDAHFEIPLQK